MFNLKGKTKTVPPAYVRWMIERDHPDVVAISEAHAHWDAWTPFALKRELANVRFIGKVADANGEVLGYILYRLRDRTIHLEDVAVDPGHLRRGIGARMVQEQTKRTGLTDACFTHVTADVPEHNVPAQLFLRALGFRCTRCDHTYEGGYKTYRFVYGQGECPDEDPKVVGGTVVETVRGDGEKSEPPPWESPEYRENEGEWW